MELSKRMTAVASMVSKGGRMVDVGTDHAYIPIYLVRNGLVARAIAADIRTGPLSRAKENVMAYGLDKLIDCRLSDGLSQVNHDEVDSIVIAGMGGDLITQILKRGQSVFTTDKELVLQPQSEIYKVRHAIHDMGYKIIEEKMLVDEGKYYVIIKAIKGYQSYYDEYQYYYGDYLIRKCDPVLLTYLQKEKSTYESILSDLSSITSERGKFRAQEITKNLVLIKGALEYYGL